MVVVFEQIILFLIIFFWLFYLLIMNVFKSGRFIFLLYSGLALDITLIVIRTIFSGHAPFSNMYESLIFFSFIYVLKLIFSGFFKGSKTGYLILPAVILNLIALLLPVELKQPDRLIPVLKSFWIFIHVPAFFTGYVSLTFLFIISIMNMITKGFYSQGADRELKLSCFFISLGIVTGAFWAEVSWAAFWSFDPKETWALITWLFVVTAFHIKSEKNRFVIILFAFLSMLFTYLGVTFILPGLHSYF